MRTRSCHVEHTIGFKKEVTLTIAEVQWLDFAPARYKETDWRKISLKHARVHGELQMSILRLKPGLQPIEAAERRPRFVVQKELKMFDTRIHGNHSEFCSTREPRYD